SAALTGRLFLFTFFPRKSFPRHRRLHAYPRSGAGVQPFARADASTPEVHFAAVGPRFYEKKICVMDATW
ncbi:MAG: hypothetical protein KFH87_02340, partial [Bacteroidetes bacterium]|nr:hypothetical protein [Bacteroidota bacterium]